MLQKLDMLLSGYGLLRENSKTCSNLRGGGDAGGNDLYEPHRSG